MIKKYIVWFICLSIAVCSISFATEQTTYNVSIFVGEQVSLQSQVRDLNSSFIWTNDVVVQNLNASVLSVSRLNVLAKDIGSSVLVISNGSQEMTLNYEVISPIESIVVKDKFLTLLVGEIYDLDYEIETVNGYNSSVGDILWSSNKEKVATIVNSDQVYTKGAGEVILTAKTANGTELGSLQVTVLGHSDKLRVTSENRDRQINVGEKLNLHAYFGSKDVTKSVEWVSDTPHVIKIDENGIITAVGEGRGVVRAQTSIVQKKATYEITANSMIDYVTLNTSKIEFNGVGQTHQLSFNLYPKDKNYPPILRGYEYTSSNPSVASVNKSGLIKAVGPGVALISVIFEDSQKRATCTVEVPETENPITDQYVPVKKLNIVSDTKSALIGQKVLIDYAIEPVNATNQNVLFSVSQGENDQIQLIDGAYYFIPRRRGNIRIEASTSDGPEDAISLSVTSPIDSLNLSLSTRRVVGTNKEVLYIGEKAELLTRIYSRSGYTKNDVYGASLIYDVKNKDIASILYEGDEIYLKALNPGKTEITVTNLEGLHEASLWVEVENPVASISTDTSVLLPLNAVYRPRVISNFLKILYTLNESFNIYDLLEYNVKKMYLSEQFIDSEIKYEENILIDLNRQPYSLSLQDSIQEHENRLNQLKNYKNMAVNGYSYVSKSDMLKDRKGLVYKFYDVSNQGIRSDYPVKLDIIVSMIGTKQQTETSLTWNESTSLSINRLGSYYDLQTLIDQYELRDSLDHRTEGEQTELLLVYMNNRELFNRVPAYEVLKSLQIVKNDPIFFDSIKELDAEITKSDLAYLSSLFYRKYINRTSSMSNFGNQYYYDVRDNEVKYGISLGYVLPETASYFGAGQKVMLSDYSVMLNKILPGVQSKESSYGKVMTYESLVLELANLLQ